MRRWRRRVAYFCAGHAKAEEIIPLAGCYERNFDAAWLKAHPGQIVAPRHAARRPRPPCPRRREKSSRFSPTRMLVMWVGETAFSTIGACYWEQGRAGLQRLALGGKARPAAKPARTACATAAFPPTTPAPSKSPRKRAGLTADGPRAAGAAGPGRRPDVPVSEPGQCRTTGPSCSSPRRSRLPLSRRKRLLSAENRGLPNLAVSVEPVLASAIWTCPQYPLFSPHIVSLLIFDTIS